ncbi:organic solute transporter alpha-like protein isoform X2 [Bradysia coprophila]|uniref:organic solute transporter alpha-like protein isoform X2 n=1 Tax=Bradysia coprophila TaxID=38358 RepID=UPI00187DC91F|nr:organic solute transporter alpha-like protein isoform X2 [Bradysia coprophila]
MIANEIDNNISKFLANITNEVRPSRPLLPRTAELFADLNTFLLVSYIVGLILFLVTTIKFVLFIPKILQNTPKPFVSRTLILCGIYTIVAASSFTSLLVPRALLFCESISVVTFALCSYQYFCLCVDYAGGESNFIRIADDVKVFNMRAPPCCCCLCFISPMHITKDRFMKVRLLILQLPIGLGLVYLILNVVYLEDSVLYSNISYYFMPFLGISVLSGVWGLQMASRMFSPLFIEYKLTPKYIAVQMVLLICKLQPLIAQIELTINGSNDNGYPITRKVYGNAIVQLLILVEVIILSFWSHYLYGAPSNAVKNKEKDDIAST